VIRIRGDWIVAGDAELTRRNNQETLLGSAVRIVAVPAIIKERGVGRLYFAFNKINHLVVTDQTELRPLAHELHRELILIPRKFMTGKAILVYR